MVLASSSLGYDELVVGLASVVGSLFIILTFVLFPNLRKLRYVELVFYVALNDLLASIGLALGPVPNDSFACWFQGLTSTMNYVSASFWTTIILYQVYRVVVQNGKVLQNMFWIHVFCWGWPVILAILPLTTNTYNNPDDESTWCFVASTRHSPPWGELFWSLTSFFAWIWLCILVNVVQIVLIIRKLRNLQVVSVVARSTVRKLIMYPIITIVCWTLNTAASLYVFISGDSFTSLSPFWDKVAMLGIILAGAQGVLNAIVFFRQNEVVREHWAELLVRVYLLLFCCRVDKNRPALRTTSNASDTLSAAEAAMETSNALHNLEQHPDREPGPISEVNNFRDTAISDADGHVNNYFSVSLPVEEEEDFVGDLRPAPQLDGACKSTVWGLFRTSAAPEGTGRRSSLFGVFRSSALTAATANNGRTVQDGRAGRSANESPTGEL